MTWPGNSQLKQLMLCMYKHSHQTPVVILLLPKDKQHTALLKSTEACQTLELGGGELFMFCHLSSSSQALRMGFSFYICCYVFCCCFGFYCRYYAKQILINKKMASVCGWSFHLLVPYASVWLLLLYLKLKLRFHIKTGIFCCVSGVGVS